MRIFLILLTVLTVGSASAQQQEFDFDRFQRLLEVDKKKLREDQFASCEAMAKRYEVTVRVRLDKQIAQLDLYCDLTSKQVRRLEVATVGAARTVGKKFRQQVEATKATKSHADALKTLITLSNEMQELLTRPENSSFWGKAVASTLTAPQKKTLSEQEAARLKFQKHAWVQNAVNEIDSELLLLTTQRDRLLSVLGDWIKKNDIPAGQRGRRGAWKILPEELVGEIVFPELDAKRTKILIGISPHHMRERLMKSAETVEQPAK